MKSKRGQRGSIRVEGDAYVGYWNTYQYNPDTDTKVRRQKCKSLGLKSIGKHAARQILAEHIAQSVIEAPRPDGSVTLEAFTRTRWVPLKEGGWRSFTNDKGREVNAGKLNAERTMGYIFEKFGNTPLEQLDKVVLQIWLNEFAKTYSESVVKHCRIYLKSILDEAVEQDYLRKNPARSLSLPNTKEVDKTTLTQDQINAVKLALNDRDALLIDVCTACGFRPSELLALRWRDFDPKLRIFTIRWTIYRGVLRPFTKTTKAGSKEQHLLRISIPDALVKDLIEFRGAVSDGHGTRQWTADDDFIFSTKEGTMMHKENFLNRVLYPLRGKLKLPVLNFQVLRRSVATEAQQDGSVKDIQTHLRHRNPDVTAQEYMQPVEESTRKMVNAVYDRGRKKLEAMRATASPNAHAVPHRFSS